MKKKYELLLRVALTILALGLFGLSKYGSEYFYCTFNEIAEHICIAFEAVFIMLALFCAIGIDRCISELCDDYKQNHPEEFGIDNTNEEDNDE